MTKTGQNSKFSNSTISVCFSLLYLTLSITHFSCCKSSVPLRALFAYIFCSHFIKYLTSCFIVIGGLVSIYIDYNLTKRMAAQPTSIASNFSAHPSAEIPNADATTSSATSSAKRTTSVHSMSKFISRENSMEAC